MDLLGAFIPFDRRRALQKGKELPCRTSGAALFADISGFTSLTEALANELGLKRGAEVLTVQLNAVYGALIAELHRYGGSVIGFNGDAITCWLDGDTGSHAVSCGLRMQQVMQQFARTRTPQGRIVELSIKVGVTSGAASRFRVGDPEIQYLDVLAGRTIDRVAAAGQQASRQEVVIPADLAEYLGDALSVSEWRPDSSGERYAIVSGLTQVREPHFSLAVPSKEELAGYLGPEEIRPWLLAPVYERLKYGQDRFLAEIRLAVVLFMRFSGLDYDLDPVAGDKLDRFVHEVQHIMTRHGGYLLQLSHGDKGSHLYAAFGAPLAHDDDPARAIAAALQLRALPSKLPFIETVQVGINQGRVRTGAYGGWLRRTYGVLGDGVNVAARLMENAQPGQILVSQRIVDATQHSYDFDVLGTLPVKGRQEPLQVSGVKGKRVPCSQKFGLSYSCRLVERGTELSRIEPALELAKAGRGQVVRLKGVAGIGKTRLVAGVAERAQSQDFRVALGSCQSTSQGIPYYPWRQIFRALFGINSEPTEKTSLAEWNAEQISNIESTALNTNPDWLLRLPLLGELVDLPIPDNEITKSLSPRLRQEALLSLATELVGVWSRQEPLLLVLDDVHWLDEASRELVLTLGRSIARMPVMLMVAHRHQDESPLPELDRLANSRNVKLTELSAAGSAELVRLRLEGSVSPLAIDLVQFLAQGNPFFIEELVEAMRESGSLNRREDGVWDASETMLDNLRQANCLEMAQGQWMLAANARLSSVDLGIPDSIHGVVQWRLDRLPETHKLTLKAASVIGLNFELDVLREAHPMAVDRDSLQEQIQTLESRQLMHRETSLPHATYAFNHNMVREIIYDTLPRDQQRELHQGVGAALENMLPDAVERLAFHFGQGGTTTKALLYLDKAAWKAKREYANETALNYFNEALDLEARWEWTKGKAEVLHILGRREEEVEALLMLGEAPKVELASLVGQYYEAVGEFSQARIAIEQALNSFQGRKDALGEVACLDRLGSMARRQGDHNDAKNCYTRALKLLHSQGLPPQQAGPALCQTLNGLGTVHRQQGYFEAALSCHQQALALSRMCRSRLHEAESLNNLGVIDFYQRRFGRAESYHQQALKIRQTIGDRPGEGVSLMNLAQVACDGGNYSQAQTHLIEALAIQQATGNRWEEQNVRNTLGILYMLVGDWDQAHRYFDEGLELSREMQDEAGRAYTLCNLGQLARDEKNLELAEQYLVHSLELARGQGDKNLEAICLSHLAIVSMEMDDLDQAIEQAQAALIIRQDRDLQLLTTMDLSTLAITFQRKGKKVHSLGYARLALDLLDESNGVGPEYPHQDYFRCYQVLSTVSGREEDGIRCLRASYDLLADYAGRITDQEMKRSFLKRVPLNGVILAEAERQKITRDKKVEDIEQETYTVRDIYRRRPVTGPLSTDLRTRVWWSATDEATEAELGRSP